MQQLSVPDMKLVEDKARLYFIFSQFHCSTQQRRPRTLPLGTQNNRTCSDQIPVCIIPALFTLADSLTGLC